MKQTNLNEIIESNVKSLQDLDVKSIEKVASEILEVRNNEGTLYIAGNGGSSSTASHFVNDLTKATRKKSNNLNIKAACLSDNTSLITAISNDISYDEIFKFQIDNNISTKDMLIVISASGNSENLIRAVDYCKNNKIKTIGLLGFDGGILLKKVDTHILIKSAIGEYELVENIHLTICHMITKYIS